MKYIILVQSRHADPDAYGPYDSEAEAEAVLKARWHRLWDEAGEDGSIDIILLREKYR